MKLLAFKEDFDGQKYSYHVELYNGNNFDTITVYSPYDALSPMDVKRILVDEALFLHERFEGIPDEQLSEYEIEWKSELQNTINTVEEVFGEGIYQVWDKELNS